MDATTFLNPEIVVNDMGVDRVVKFPIAPNSAKAVGSVMPMAEEVHALCQDAAKDVKNEGCVLPMEAWILFQ